MGPPENKNPPPVPAGEGRIASDFGKRLNRYGTAKKHTSALIKAIGPERAKNLRLPFTRITECGDWLKFRHYYTVAQIKLAGASFCKKHLVCSLCAIRRASRLMASYLERYSVIRKAKPELSAHLATLTVKNSHDLGEVCSRTFSTRFDCSTVAAITKRNRRSCTPFKVAFIPSN